VTASPQDLGASASVAPGGIQSVAVGEVDLVIWRTESGKACVMDARCPHQWSHLAADGVVAGEELVCQTHFWRFDTDGTGVKVAMNGRRDVKAPTTVYPSHEIDGRIVAELPTDWPEVGS
jgi:phenylpropionate dioxygenase-like ring-hydroxylating dioxygenase large terminal subunit